MLLFKIKKIQKEDNYIKYLIKINKYYKQNPGCSINNAITFVPATKHMVEKYSSLKSKLLKLGIEKSELTDKLEEIKYNIDNI